MNVLAILGGSPVITGELAAYRSMGEAEKEAVNRVIESDCLSGFYGSPGPEFNGGPEVQAFEQAWRARFDVAHAISVNSATSGLFAAMGAIGIGPGDQVIVPPWTMSATAMAPLIYGGIPVFADIEEVTFGLDPAAVEAAITPQTRAILAVNLFGHPARLHELRELADRHGLFLVEDNAQAPLGFERGRRAGTIGHIGVFSLNYHKHIHTGEGGVCVTSSDRLADRLAQIRNHGENVVTDDPDALVNMIGFNYRMTELSAAVGSVQLENVDQHVSVREKLADQVSKGISDLEGISPPVVRDGCRHNYYCWTARLDEEVLGVDRDLFSRALSAEGVPNAVGYVKPLYHLPIFQRRLAMGRDGFPFTLGAPDYSAIRCPVAERMYEQEALLFEPCAFEITDSLADQFVMAIRKVHQGRDDLRKLNA